MTERASSESAGPLRANGSRVRLSLLLAAAAILAVEPVAWLVNTWRDPVYDSNGVLIAALVAMALGWSVTSPLRPDARQAGAHAWALLAGSALVRLAGQVSAINVIGALTLVVDVYALALLARLDQRARALSPGWIAIAFAFSMPLERMVQRSLGYGLQLLSADGACGLLGAAFGNVACEGIRIILDGKDVLVDLPCSGARTLLLSALGFTLAAAVLRPGVKDAVTGAAVALGAALGANVVRITVLAIGIAFPERFGGIDVMAQPWHDAIGYAALLLGLVALALWARRVRLSCEGPHAGAQAAAAGSASEATFVEAARARFCRLSGPARLSTGIAPALAAVAAALVIVNLPRRAIDVAQADPGLAAPAQIMGVRAQPIALADYEKHYFTAFGGAAAKASYGPSSLMLVRTTSPLRHLHAPDECLRGLGFAVTYGGMSFAPVPTAHYLAAAPDGRRYRIDVTFASETGHVTGSIAVAVWQWLSGSARRWTAIQRITPVEVPLSEHRAFSAAVLHTLGIEPQPLASPRQEAPRFITTSTVNSTKG